jgi:hypothetical protein
VPAGVTVTFLPKRLEAGETSSIATISADATAEPRQTSFTFRATEANQASVTSRFPLQILHPKITLGQLAASTLTVVRGGLAVTTDLLLERQFGATDSVRFFVEQVPTGVAATFVTPAIGKFANSATLQLTATDAAALGASSLRVRASMTGASDVLLTVLFFVAGPGIVPPSAYTFTPPTASISMARGVTWPFSISVQRIGGFNGAITLTPDAVPTGLNVPPALIDINSTSVVIPIRADLTALPGEHTVILRGRGQGIADVTLPIRIVLTPLFELVGTNVTLPQGSVGSSSISIRGATGLGEVNLKVSTHLPDFLTGSLNPSSTSGPFSSLVLTAAHNAPTGAWDVEVVATISDLMVARTTIRVTITP